jgi:parallel beta-helix repeat protein
MLIMLLIFGTGDAKIFKVCNEGCDYASITTAINSANSGDVLEVSGGNIFNENIRVTKPLTLKGIDSGRGKPIINANSKDCAIALLADGIFIEGFNVTNSLASGPNVWAGIYVTSNNNTIEDNIAFNNENGVLISNSHNNIIINNTIMNNKYGVKIESSKNNRVASNDFNNNNYGLLLFQSEDNKIKGNNASNNDFGIQLNASTGNILDDNRMSGNSYNFGAEGENTVSDSNIIDGKHIYYLLGARGKEINSTSNAGTFYCINCDDMSVKDLDLNNNFNGIYLYNTTNSTIEHNSLSGNGNGILLINSRNNTIVDNIANLNVDGISLISSKNNEIKGNSIRENSNAGLYALGSNYNGVSYNRASKNERGFFINKSGSNRLMKNDISQNLIGIYLSHAWMNDIFNNSIEDNLNGIMLISCSENNITENKIFNNHIGLVYDPLDIDALGNNLMLNNTKDKDLIPPEQTTGRPTGSGPSISIDVDSKPEGATILKDGEYAGKTPGKVYFTSPGDYIIELSLNGFHEENLTIEVPMETKRLEVVLEREG